MKFSFLTVLLVVLLTGSVWGAPVQNKSAQAASILFERFESVYYSDQSLLVNSSTPGFLSIGERGALRGPFAFLLTALSSLGGRVSANVLKNAKGVFVGAKDFRSPAGFGLVRSQNCYIIVLGSQSAFQLRSQLSTPPISTANRTLIWNWTAKLGEFGELDGRPSNIFAAQIGKSFLLVSNNREEIQTIAERLASASFDTQTLKGIKGWELIEKRPVWGHRRYRHAGVVDPLAAGMRNVTWGAEALVFYVDLQTKSCFLRLFSNVADEGTPAKINRSGAILPRLKPGRGPFWDTHFPLRDEDSHERLVFVMGLLGFGVYV